jgi:hypothetical protein
VIDPNVKNSPIDSFPDHQTMTAYDILEKYLYIGDDRNIVMIIVDGKVINLEKCRNSDF